LSRRVVEQLEQNGFRGTAFAPFEAALEAEAPSPLSLAELRESELSALIDSFQVQLPSGSTAILSHVSGVQDPEALERLLAEVEGARFLDQRAFIGDLFWRYRQRAIVLIGVGLLGVFGLLVVRYRSVRLAVACLAPAALAALLALALLSIVGTPINLLHLLGLLLVLCFGVDYSVFLIEAGADGPRTTATLLALSIACLSTCLSFGLLSVSAFPALRSLGQTTGLGVLLSLLLAPMALRMVPRSSST
jgi:predicted exporter